MQEGFVEKEGMLCMTKNVIINCDFFGERMIGCRKLHYNLHDSIDCKTIRTETAAGFLSSKMALQIYRFVFCEI